MRNVCGRLEDEMSDKDLIKALRDIAVETGSLVCQGCGYEHECRKYGCAIINKAAAWLQTLTEAQAVKLDNALDMVRAERCRQDSLWGDQSGNHPFEWISILGEEYGELCEAVNETFFSNAAHPDRGGFEEIVKEAAQVAAVAVAIIETVQLQHFREEA